MRYAGIAVALEGLASLAFAVAVVVDTAAGTSIQGISNGYGFASWFVIVGAGVLTGAWALITGRRWGRGIGVFTNLIMLGVAWYAGVGSHQVVIGIVVAVYAIAVLALLFSAPAVAWAAGDE